MLLIDEVDGAALTQLGHALHLATSFVNSLTKKKRKEAVNIPWGSTNELVSMLDKDYPSHLEALFKGKV